VLFAEQALSQQEAERYRPAGPGLTDDDHHILAVLDAHAGKTLILARTIRESVRMQCQDWASLRLLSDSTLRGRLPVLFDQGLVARPPGTKKKGVFITDPGR
jgi:hypothetical protein